MVSDSLTVEDLCFTNFNLLRTNWSLLNARDPLIHEEINNSLLASNLTHLDKGFSKRSNNGKLSDFAFNLLDEYTWNTCSCSEMTDSPLDCSRYLCTHKPCGKDRYCPRCNFRNEQQFYRKYSPYWNSGLDFYHLTFTAGNLYNFNYGGNYSSFHADLSSLHKKLNLIQSGRTRHDWMLGSLWSEEAACVDLLHNNWNSHLHVIIACPRGSAVDLEAFQDLNVNVLCKKIDSKSYFDNCLRYLNKPIHSTMKERYSSCWNNENSRMLYRRVKNNIEILRELFSKRKVDSSGYFRRSLTE